MPKKIEFKSGALIDTRSDEAKSKDYFQKEIVASAAPVVWVEKPKDKWRRFPDQNQFVSGSCVAQTVKKLGGVILWLKEKTYVVFSATPIYQARSNKPAGGMVGVEAFDIWKRDGLTLEQLVGSEMMNDPQMDAVVVEQYKKDVGRVFKIGGHIGIEEGNFESVASTIQQTEKAVMVWFYFLGEEWSREIPTVETINLKQDDASALRHSVAAVDFFLYNGIKYILVEDSAHFGGFTYHLISEEFFKIRNFFARYPMNFVFQAPPELTPVPQPEPNKKPRYTFTLPLAFGQRGEAIRALQNILKYEGLYPINTESTSYFGAITASGVLKFQIKHNVAPLSELNSLAGRRWGLKSITISNKIYGQ